MIPPRSSLPDPSKIQVSIAQPWAEAATSHRHHHPTGTTTTRCQGSRVPPQPDPDPAGADGGWEPTDGHC